MVLSYLKVVEHLMYVCCESHSFFSETDKHSDKAVVHIWTFEQHVDDGHSLKLSTAVKTNSKVPGLMWLINTKNGQITAQNLSQEHILCQKTLAQSPCIVFSSQDPSLMCNIATLISCVPGF